MGNAINVFVGWDPKEEIAFDVCKWSACRRSSVPVRVHRLDLAELVQEGVYYRGWTHDEDGRRVDNIDGTRSSTEFSYSRFLVPELCKMRGITGPAIYVDSDVLFLADIAELVASVDPEDAVSVVKLDFRPLSAVKMDQQLQTQYPRKCWSALMAFNAGHPALDALTVEAVNTKPGSYLHRFEWLSDDVLGSLPDEWQWVPGHSRLPTAFDTKYAGARVKAVHFTSDLPPYDGVVFGDVWRQELAAMRAYCNE